MTIEEVYKILETEKFCKLFNNCSLLHKMRLLRMRKIFSTYFKIPEKEIYLNMIFFRFFSLYIKRFTELDIDQIKLDIMNGVPIVDICLTYMEPMEVIMEIKDNIESNIDILSNKIYITKELEKAFNLTSSAITKNKLLLKNKLSNEKTSVIFWLGKDIKNLIGTDVKLKRNETTLKNIPLISLAELSKALKLQHYSVLERVTNNYRIFGYDIELIGDKKQYFITKELYNKIVNNRKYYIAVKEAKLDKKIDYSLLTYYKLVYGVKISLSTGFIKKENVIKLNDLLKIKENDFCGYIHSLYSNIELSNNDSYDLSVLLRIYGNNNEKTRIMLFNNLGIKSKSIDKMTALKVIMFMNKGSIRYNQSKEQGIKNGKINR